MNLKEAIQSANLFSTIAHARAKADAVDGISEKAQHTPGPWIIGTDDGFNANQITSKSSGICEVYGIFLHTDVESAKADKRCAQGMANASLIAAAPELLAALESCLGPLQDEYNRATHTGHATRASVAFLKAKQAILKAKGSL